MISFSEKPRMGNPVRGFSALAACIVFKGFFLMCLVEHIGKYAKF
jgi:hypothetical protein